MDFLTALKKIISRQQSSCDWTHGNVIKYFNADGFPCARFQDGEWWHYDIKNQCWW
jgi:hypothetical protein